MRHRRKWADRGQNGVHFGTSCPQSSTNCTAYTYFVTKLLHTVERNSTCGCLLGTDFRDNALKIFCGFVLAVLALFRAIFPTGYSYERIRKFRSKPTCGYIPSIIPMQRFSLIHILPCVNVARLEGVFETTPPTGPRANQTVAKHHAALAGIARHH